MRQQLQPWNPGSGFGRIAADMLQFRFGELGMGFGRPQPVHNPAGEDQAHSVGKLKGKNYVAVINLVPSDIVVKSLLEQSDDLTVNVVDGGGKKQQGADDPTVVPCQPRRPRALCN